MITRYRKLQEGEILEHGDRGKGGTTTVPKSDEEIDNWWETRRPGEEYLHSRGYQYWRVCEPQPTVPIVITPLTNRLKIHAHKV